MPAAKKTTAFTLRITAEDLEQLRQRAENAGVSMTAYVLAAALDHPLSPSSLEERFSALEARVVELERELA